jgi:hypothetical protein
MAHKINNSGGSSRARPDPNNKGTAVMPFDASSRHVGVSIGEKVTVLSQFIAKDLEARARSGVQLSDCYLLIARSPDSPVAQALRAHTATLAQTGIRLRAIFSEVEPGRAAAAVQTAPFSIPSECRIIRDSRLLAAHEQLVLAPDCTWIGDCMRREPTRRDAFERFAENCAETATHAARSFERLWRIAVPVDQLPPLSAALASQLPDFVGATPPRPEGLRRQ